MPSGSAAALASWSSSTSRAPWSRCTSTIAGTRALHPRWPVQLRGRGRDRGRPARIVGVRAAEGSARVAVRVDRGSPPQRDCARRLRALLWRGGGARGGSNPVTGPQRTGCRGPLERGRALRHQDRRATARRVDTRNRSRVTRVVSPPMSRPRPALLLDAERDSATALRRRRSAAGANRETVGACTSSKEVTRLDGSRDCCVPGAVTPGLGL